MTWCWVHSSRVRKAKREKEMEMNVDKCNVMLLGRAGVATKMEVEMTRRFKETVLFLKYFGSCYNRGG